MSVTIEGLRQATAVRAPASRQCEPRPARSVPANIAGEEASIKSGYENSGLLYPPEALHLPKGAILFLGYEKASVRFSNRHPPID